jgi:hypothetical protein
VDRIESPSGKFYARLDVTRRRTTVYRKTAPARSEKLWEMDR